MRQHWVPGEERRETKGRREKKPGKPGDKGGLCTYIHPSTHPSFTHLPFHASTHPAQVRGAEWSVTICGAIDTNGHLADLCRSGSEKKTHPSDTRRGEGESALLTTVQTGSQFSLYPRIRSSLFAAADIGSWPARSTRLAYITCLHGKRFCFFSPRTACCSVVAVHYPLSWLVEWL